jgi:hypothetical protein
MRPTTGRRRKAAVSLAALGGVLVTSGLVGLGGQGASASSHREAPLIAGEPKYDNTDTYAFVSPDRRGKVTLIAQLAAVRGAGGRPELLLVRHRRPLRDQGGQRRGRES